MQTRVACWLSADIMHVVFSAAFQERIGRDW